MAQWWDEWQLRILVLASLSAQYFLVLFAGVRKFHIPPWLKFSFRLAHTGSDALAIFALATLVSRQKIAPGSSYARGIRDMELLWAPILVMHLGGQVVITTYKIEDNEQWSRHILTSLSKVSVALYVFYKSWSSSDKRLLAATILLFILVTIRCFQKSLNLKRSSFNALREAKPSVDNRVIGGKDHVGEIERLEFIQHARDDRLTVLFGDSDLNLRWHLFLDISCSYSKRLNMLRCFRVLEEVHAYSAIECLLCDMTSFLYTKEDTRAADDKSVTVIFSLCIQVLNYATLVTAICLVHTSRQKEDFSGEDNMITLVLFYGTLLLELVYIYVLSAFGDKFSGRILQHNLIGLFAFNRRHSKLRIVAGWLKCKYLLDGFWHMEPSYSCPKITELAHQHVEYWWVHYITDTESYTRINDTRGEWTLARNRCLQQLGWSTRRPFDESIVLWHLATALCVNNISPPDRDYCKALVCQEMSNYMVHLLSDNPEMLMPGSRKSLLAIAYEELEALLKGERTPPDEKELTRVLTEKLELAPPLLSRHDDASLIGDAWELAKSLMCYEETRRWTLIEGVWVEMLCFSAGRCRGYLHAEALGTGVEFLSYIWALLAFTGMETFPEKLQRNNGHSFDSDESSDPDLAREGGDAVTLIPSERSGVEILPEELQRREGYSFDNDESLARERGDATQSEDTVDIVLEP